MPVISTRFPTSTRNTYLPSTTSSIGDTLYRRSSLIGSYRSVNGDDSTSSRFGTSVSKRHYTSTTSIPSSSLTRNSIDRDYYRSKPPLGSRFRSDSRFRDLSLDNGYHHYNTTTTTTTPNSINTNPITSNINNKKSNYSLSQSLLHPNQNQTKRVSASSLARSVATSGADLYEKYSVANYKPNCELSRSRSLTDSNIIDSISGNHHQTIANRRSTSRDRCIPTTGSLLAGSASTRDYLRSTSPITSTGLKVKQTNQDQLTNVVSNNLVNSRCLHSNSPVSHTQTQSKSQLHTHTHTHSIPSANNNNNNNNNNNYIPNDLTTANLNKISKQRIVAAKNTNSHHLKTTLTQKHSNNNNKLNNNDNALSDSIVVSSSSINNNINNNPNNLKTPKKLQSNVSSIGIAIKSTGAIKKSTIKTTTPTTSITNGNNGTAKTTITTNDYESMNGTISPNANNNNNNNNNIHEKKLMSSESFKRRLGTYPLSPYRNPDFLKCEYDLARSQVINSRSKSATGEKNINLNKNNNNNNHNNSDKSKLVNGYVSLSSLTSSPAKDSNRNKVSTSITFGVGQAKVCAVSSASAIPKRSTQLKSTLANNNHHFQSENMNIVQHNSPVDLLDDIKYIDSDGSERKNPPSTANVASLKEFFNDTSSTSSLTSAGLTKSLKIASTLPSNGTAKKFNDAAHANKYNTITNGSCPHQSNGIASKAVPEEMLSSASSSTSTLSAMTDTSTSSVLPKSIIKESHAPVKQNHLIDNGDNKTNSVRGTLPPTPSRYDRDAKLTGTSSISSRILPDTDAFTKSLAASSISDRTADDDNTEGLCGLRNIGNTCFMNSIIQCLGHTKDLTRYLKTKFDVNSSNAAKDSRIVTEFAKLIKEMWSGSSRSVTPSELKSAFSTKHRMYSGCSQQDAQEFLRFFLDALHCTLNTGTKGEKLEIDDNLTNNQKADLTWEWYSKVENSVIKDLFVGQLKSSLKCTVCGNSSVTFDPFWDLSVSLPTSSRCKLESCLDLFIKEEILDGDEMPTCSKCKTRRKSTKSFTIQRFPKYLAIHLKRFSETRWSKMTNIVEFPVGERELNMAPYGANSKTVQYSLYGICNHMGSTAGGHYVAVCKHPTLRKWHEFNDNIVSPVHESSLVSSSAYVLFYERV